MVEAELMQHGSLKIVHMHGVFDDVVAKFIGVPVHKARFYAATSHPDTKATRMVISAIIFL